MELERAINEACEKFRVILTEQAERVRRMETGGSEKMPEKPVIGICDGDGIGPIIMAEARRVLYRLMADEIAAGGIVVRDIPGLTIERRLELGQSVPDDVLAAVKECTVLLKGPTTTPKGGGGKDIESANVTLRRELDLFANVRPVKIPELGVDWTFFRENTEGEYVLGSRGVSLDGVLACDFKIITDAGTRRICRAACDFARRSGKKRVAIVTKANIMKKTDGNFSRICHEVVDAEYPELEATDWYADIIAANLINPKRQREFEVFVLPNLYGDILTDEAAQLQGGVGTAGSVNMGSRYAMFEAIHGSAPRVIEEGRGHLSNPESILRALALLLEHIGSGEKAAKLSAALDAVSGTEGLTCAGFGDAVLARL